MTCKPDSTHYNGCDCVMERMAKLEALAKLAKLITVCHTYLFDDHAKDCYGCKFKRTIAALQEPGKEAGE